MDIKVLSISDKGKASEMTVSEKVFGAKFNMPLVHQVLVAEQNALRSGTKAQKSRSDVRGGGAKPWKQKGTGRARAGTSRSPIWRTGGVTFAAVPRDYSQKVNKKMWQGAIRSLLSEMFREGTLIVCDDFVLENAKTKELLLMMNKVNVEDALIVTEEVEENLYLASRNLYKAAVIAVRHLNVLALMQYKQVIITKACLEILEKNFDK